MSYIVASLPPLKCFIKREFLYNDHKGHNELEPAIWVSLKSLRGQVLRLAQRCWKLACRHLAALGLHGLQVYGNRKDRTTESRR